MFKLHMAFWTVSCSIPEPEELSCQETVMAQKENNLRTITSPEDKRQMSFHLAMINQY